MAPNPSKANQLVVGSHAKSSEQSIYKPSRLSTDGLQRTVSDISFEICKEATEEHNATTDLAPISEVENAKCECCGMCEECTKEYISRVRDKFSGKLICGLCAAAVNEEMEKNGGKREEGLEKHMSACVKFNRIGRSYPVLYQAESIKEILKKSSRAARAKSISPRDHKNNNNIGQNIKGGIARSSSCIPAITREVHDGAQNN